MADTAPTVAPKIAVTRAANPSYSPIAVHIPIKLRATAIQLVNDLQPEGNPHPDRLKVAKETALALIAAEPESTTGIEVKLEVGAGSAAQIMVIVFPHQL